MNIDELNLDLLDKLTRTPGLPGREAQVAALIHASLPERWETRQDALGNLIAHIPGKGRRVMLLVHMDEVGLIVRRITPEGFLRVERMGGMGVQALPGSRLTLWTRAGEIPANVGVLPQHLDDHYAPDIATLYVDIGAASRQEVEALGVRVGDGLTWRASLERVGQRRISAKALDDRLGCLVLLTLAERLRPPDLECDLYLAFTVQEETMLMGGLPAVQAFAPEIVIGVDGTLAFDTPDLFETQSELCLGRGPALKWMDTMRGKQVSYVPDWGLAQRVVAFAERMGAPLQSEVVTGLSTALSPVPYAGSGVKTLAFSIPIRYHHTPVETADLSDVGALVDVLTGLLTHPF